MEILQEKCIRTNCVPKEKNDIVRDMGQMLYEAGYVTNKYIKAMLDKEESMDTYLGNDIAIPHGIESARDEVISSGLGVMVFPDGIDWDGKKVRVVIGIAGREEEHVEVLSHIAVTLMEMEEVERLVRSDKHEIHEMLNP